MKHLPKITLLVVLFSMISSYINAQNLNFTINCSSQPNAAIDLLNNKIESVLTSDDTTYVYFTWKDNCALIPVFTLVKIDSCMIEIKMKNNGGEPAACDCGFSIKLAISGLEGDHYYLKINDSIVKPNPNRYNLNVVREYFYPPRSVKREIYVKDGIMMVECFYDWTGKLVKERFYNEYYGSFRSENDY